MVHHNIASEIINNIAHGNKAKLIEKLWLVNFRDKHQQSVVSITNQRWIPSNTSNKIM